MNKVRFAIDMILQKKLNFILSVMLTGVGFFLIGFTLLIYLAGAFSEESAENVLSQGIGQTGIVNFRDAFDFASENGREFRKAVFESDLIHSIGAVNYVYYEKEDFTELYEIQSEDNIKKDMTVADSSQMSLADMLHVLEVDLEVFNISDMSLEDGVPPQNLKYPDQDTRYLYLGHAYHDIPVGTQFVYEPGDETKIVYEVAGIIEKGEAFVSEDLSGVLFFGTIRNDVNTDYEIICINNDYSRHAPWFFSVDKNYSMDEGMKELEKIADRYGIKIQKGYPLREAFDIAGAQTAVIQESLLDMLLCLAIVIVVVVTTLQIVQIYHCSKHYGILYAVGFSTADMQWMLIVRNVICFVLSVCVGILLLILTGQRCFVINNQAKELFFELLSYRVLPVDFILMVFLFFVVSYIPCRMFHRMDPVRMIQGE